MFYKCDKVLIITCLCEFPECVSVSIRNNKIYTIKNNWVKYIHINNTYINDKICHKPIIVIHGLRECDNIVKIDYQKIINFL